MRRTLQSPRIVQPVKDFAVGLHYPEKRRTFFFKDYTIGSTPKRMITIGRGSDCDILFDSRFVSTVHAVLERRGEAMWIADHESTNGVYVNDVRISEAVALTVGMRIIIGHELLVAADAEGFLLWWNIMFHFRGLNVGRITCPARTLACQTLRKAAYNCSKQGSRSP